MFGMGGSEIIVILIVALLFLGPDKLPEAARTISKGIRDLKKQSKTLQQQIENDERIGGAIRDLKSALRGDELPVRPPVRTPPPKKQLPATDAVPSAGDAATAAAVAAIAEPATPPAVTLPATAGDPDPAAAAGDIAAAEQLASLIKPADGTIAKGAATAEPDLQPEPEPKQKHG
jgi:sec-independent protein translocase protein TatB